MLIIYDLTTKEIKGVSMLRYDTSKAAPEPTLASTFPKTIAPNRGGFVVPNDERIANEPHMYQLTFNARGQPTGVVRKPPQSILEVSTDAMDHDGDGIPEIMASGEAEATITASLRDPDGRLITNEVKEVRFKTTGGTLKDRVVKTNKGVAKTILIASKETITPTITAESDGCRPGKLQIEFVNPDVVYF